MSGTLFHYPRLRAVDSAGRPISGALLTVYRAGTSTLANIYAGKNLQTPLDNPLTANAAGEFAAIYLDPEAGHDYRMVCTTGGGVLLWSEDNVPAGISVTSDIPGPSGGDGLSVVELTIYQRAASDPGTPTGGSFNFTTQSLSPPSGWSVTVPSGSSEPVWISKGVASVQGTTGTDSTITWTAPTVLAQDGAQVDIIFKREATQPATPSASSGVPAGWYSNVGDVPASSDLLWSSVGKRDNASRNWIWQVPIQVEGDTGATGPSAEWYYIKPTSGTAIKNGSGTLTVEARRVFAGNDVLLSGGTIKLYVGTTEVTVANGYATGSNGYTGVFDSGDISGAAVVTLKDGPSGTPLDTVTLVDVVDGTVGGVGTDAVYGYIDASAGLAWVRASDQTTWSPAGTTTQLDCTFVQSGADVARVAHVITRDADGILTGAPGTHAGGDLNGARVTVTELNESTQAMTVKFAYSHSGDETAVAETVVTSMAGGGTPGDPGDPGDSATYITLSAAAIPLFAYQNGLVPSYTGATGTAVVWHGDTDVTSSATLSISASSNVSGAAINSSGVYSITALNADNGSITIQAVYNAQTVTTQVQFFKQYAGFEIVGSLPGTNLFEGRTVYLTTDDKLYRYTGSSWTRAVDGADLTANSVTANAIQAGAVTAAKISVTQLSSISANLGTVTAGIVQSPSGGAKFDLGNARILYNSAPGQTGGYVRVQGAGFGPSSNYLDWYGPKPAGQSTDSGIIANLTDAAALWFQKTTGESKSTAQRIRGEFEPKAWCNFNGSTLPPTIRDRYNISTVTRFSTGVYVVTFAEALANANYVVTGNANISTGGLSPLLMGFSSLTTTGFNISTRDSGNSEQDAAVVTFIVFGSNVSGGSNVTQPSGGTGGGTIGWGNLPSNYNLP